MKANLLALLAGGALLGLAAVAGAKSELAERMDRGVNAAPSSSVRSVQDEMAESFRKHRPNAAEIQARLAELRDTGKTRRAAHVADLKLRFSESLLHNQAVLAELRAHARRVAFLNRAKFIATTELDEPRRSKVLARIDKLMNREQDRHTKKIEKLKLSGAHPGASGMPTPAPAPAGSAK